MKDHIEMDYAINIRRNGNKQVRCVVCSRSVRSDNLKRHATTHKDILSMSEDEAREELKVRHATFLEREQKRQKNEKIAHKEGIPLPKDIIEGSSEFNNEDLEKELLKDNQSYFEGIELGKKIAATLDRELFEKNR